MKDGYREAVNAQTHMRTRNKHAELFGDTRKKAKKMVKKCCK
jgi:hypothetical protein